MFVSEDATAPVAKNNGAPKLQPDALAEAAAEMSAISKGITKGMKLHVTISTAMFVEPDKLAARIKDKKLRKFTGEFKEARRVIASLEVDQKDAPAEAKRSLTNFYNNAAKNATYVMHHLKTKSDVDKKRLCKNPATLKTLISGLKLKSLKTDYEAAKPKEDPGDNVQAGNIDPQERLNQRLSDAALIRGIKVDAYVAPEGDLAPALVRVGSSGKLDLVDVFPSDNTAVAAKLANNMKGPSVNKENLQLEAIIDAMLVRDKYFKPTKTAEPVDPQKPDGDKFVVHPQIGLVANGHELVVGYAKAGPRPSMRLILKGGVVVDN